MSHKVKFADLEVGDKFLSHGILNDGTIYMKIKSYNSSHDDNCVSLVTGKTSWVVDDCECNKLPLINTYQYLEGRHVKHNQ